MNELEINGQKYKFAKIDALKQFHIVRRLAPIIGELLSAVGPSFKEGQAVLNDEEQFTKALGPIAGAIGKLSDEEANYVLFSLLGSVQRHQAGGGWANIVATGHHTLMFQDIELKAMFQLAVKAFSVNLGGFIDALPSGLKEAAVTQA